MNNLVNLQTLFNNSLFRIPDYQRGYSWGTQQLEEFWSDLTSIFINQKHYTGMISKRLIPLSELYTRKDKYKNEVWLAEAGYNVYEVVDGQQRLTTIIILINEILAYCKKNDIKEINGITLDELQEKYMFKVKAGAIVRTYKFGYTEDNPSDKYFKNKILEDPECKETVEETFYTQKLTNAKNFFKEKIKDLTDKKGNEALFEILRKVTLNLVFNLYDINDDFNVFVAFETMNNRGKRLSYLELLKNRLIYLSTLFEGEPIDREEVRDSINRTWKNVYSYLGKNTDINHPLIDDEFLQHHWMIYFGYNTRKIEGNKTIPFYTYLLNRYFVQQNISGENLYTPAIEENLYSNDFAEETEREVLENNSDDTEEVKENKQVLRLIDIKKYINSMNELIPFWYQTYVPTSNHNKNIEKYLFRLSELGYVNARPLVTVILFKDDIEDTEKVELLRLIERFNFIQYRLCGYASTSNNSVFFNLARDLYNDEVTIEEIKEALNNIDYLADNNVVNTDALIDRFKKLFKRDGYYSWSSIKYLLYIYDTSLSNSLSEQQLDIKDYFNIDPKDSYSVEHIYPQKAVNKYWKDRYDKYTDNQRKILSSSLGNLLPLSKRINSTLQNHSFDSKVERYKKGSKSELEVSNKEEWTSKEILDRGMEIINFMEEEFDFRFPNDYYRKQILGLEFLAKKEIDEQNNVYEPYSEEIEKDLVTRGFDEELLKEHLNYTNNPKVVEIYHELESYCMSLPDVRKHTTQNYIGFSVDKIFMEFHFQVNNAHLMILDGDYNDPLNKITILSDKYNWSKKTKVVINDTDDLEYVKSLIKQSYDIMNS